MSYSLFEKKKNVFYWNACALIFADAHRPDGDATAPPRKAHTLRSYIFHIAGRSDTWPMRAQHEVKSNQLIDAAAAAWLRFHLPAVSSRG